MSIVPAANKGDDHIINTIKSSLQNLQTDYIDLYLIHWPGVSGLPVTHPDNLKYRKSTWNTFMKLQKEGLIRSIGVSNYTIKHLNELIDDGNLSIPSVNQVEWHPHYHIPELLNFCKEKNIFLQAYSSLGSSNYTTLRDDPNILTIARELNKSPAQILLRWALQQEIGIIPKGSSKSHIYENIDLNFEIPKKSMDLLSNMKVKEKYAWNPNSVV